MPAHFSHLLPPTKLYPILQVHFPATQSTPPWLALQPATTHLPPVSSPPGQSFVANAL